MDITINGWPLTPEEVEHLRAALGDHYINLIVAPGATHTPSGIDRDSAKRLLQIGDRIQYKMTHYNPMGESVR
jgi:hypothetical protein